MQPAWEEALKAQRERVLNGCGNKSWCTTRPDAEQRIDNALRLARAIGVAEACTCVGQTCREACSAAAEVDAIIRELEG